MKAPPSRFPYLSISFAVALTVLFVAARSSSPLELAGRYGFSLSSPTVLGSLTYVFVHGGIGHLLLNLALLVAFSLYAESYGGRRIWTLVLLVGTIGAAYGEMAMAYVTGVPRTSVLVGASGAISGMAGWSFVLGVREPQPDLWTRLVKAAAAGWFALQAVAILVVTRESGPSATAYWAHLWGFTLGAAIGALTRSSDCTILRRASELLGAQRPADALALLDEPLRGRREMERLRLVSQAWAALGDREQAAASWASLVRACPSSANIEALVEAGGSHLLPPDERLRFAASQGVSARARKALLMSFADEPLDAPGRASALLQLAELLRAKEPVTAETLLKRIAKEYVGTEMADLATSRLRSLPGPSP